MSLFHHKFLINSTIFLHKTVPNSIDYQTKTNMSQQQFHLDTEVYIIMAPST